MSPWRILSLWAPVGVCMAGLYFVSSRADLGRIEIGWDKMAHAGAYAFLGLWALRAFHGGLNRIATRPTLAATLLTACYALLDEMHQGRVPGRDASMLDWVADLVGMGLAIGFVGLLVGLRSMIGAHGSGGGAKG